MRAATRKPQHYKKRGLRVPLAVYLCRSRRVGHRLRQMERAEEVQRAGHPIIEPHRGPNRKMRRADRAQQRHILRLIRRAKSIPTGE